jgi:transcriptional regulator with XRE-family HTH domain
MSRLALAKAMRVDAATVWRWETGKTTPSFETMSDIAQALSTTVHTLFPDLQAWLHTQPLQEEEPVNIS